MLDKRSDKGRGEGIGGIVCGHTLDRLCLKEIMHHVLHPRRLQRLLYRMLKILKDYPPWQVRVSSFELCALVAYAAADVDVEGVIWSWFPPAELLLHRNTQSATSARTVGAGPCSR